MLLAVLSRVGSEWAQVGTIGATAIDPAQAGTSIPRIPGHWIPLARITSSKSGSGRGVSTAMPRMVSAYFAAAFAGSLTLGMVANSTL